MSWEACATEKFSRKFIQSIMLKTVYQGVQLVRYPELLALSSVCVYTYTHIYTHTHTHTDPPL